jgi:hypothetical protein
MIKRLNRGREPRTYTGHEHGAVKRACDYLRRILDDGVLALLAQVEKFAKPRFLEWFENAAESLGLNRKARQRVLAIVG